MFIILITLLNCSKNKLSFNDLKAKYNLRTEKVSNLNNVTKIDSPIKAQKFFEALTKLNEAPLKVSQILYKGEHILSLVADRGIGLNIHLNGQNYGYLKAALRAKVFVERDEDHKFIKINGAEHKIYLEGFPLGTTLHESNTWHEIDGNKIKIYGQAYLKTSTFLSYFSNLLSNINIDKKELEEIAVCYQTIDLLITHEFD